MRGLRRCRVCGKCLPTCPSSVFGLRKSRSQMPWLECPSAMSASTSRSRGVSSASGPALRRWLTRRETMVGSMMQSPSAIRRSAGCRASTRRSSPGRPGRSRRPRSRPLRADGRGLRAGAPRRLRAQREQRWCRCYSPGAGAAASANGLPSESRHTAHRSPGWMTEPPSSRTFSTVAARSATLK
jgi:hypothetical protein